MTKTDKRILKSKKAIRSAFATLLLEKGMEDITVKEIAELADVNRKTFYNNYDNVYQLIEEIENEVLESIQIHRATDYQTMFTAFTDLIAEDMEFYRKLVAGNTHSKLIEKVYAAIQEQAIISLDSGKNSQTQSDQLLITYTSAGNIALIRQWFASEDPMPIQELIKLITKLMEACLKVA